MENTMKISNTERAASSTRLVGTTMVSGLKEFSTELELYKRQNHSMKEISSAVRDSAKEKKFQLVATSMKAALKTTRSKARAA